MWGRRALVTGIGFAVVVLGGHERAAPPAGECSDAERATNTPRDTTDDLRLQLVVPAYRLDVVERGVVARSIAVAVGQPRYPTPLGHFRIDYVVWNPWWRPPASDWARKERPQAPGWQNPVGRVKLHVTGLVFLHGTPLEESRGSAASHACVRMSNEDALALARLVHDHAGPPLSPATIDSLVADTSLTRTLALTRAVPIDVEYRLAEILGDEVVAYPDVYGLSGARGRSREMEVVDAFRRVGLDTTRLRGDSVRALTRAARRSAARMSVAHLLATSPSVVEPR
jgi:murein L,D-transpeptidase YcbB/YkuD